MALILTEPGFTAADRLLTSQPAGNRPPSFNKFRMSGGVDGQPAGNRPPSFNQFRMSGGVDGRTPASPPPTGQSAAHSAAGYLAAAHSAHPELVEGWPRATGWVAAADQPQLIPAAPAAGGEGAV